jgi:tetratricopeptide (TPR) repeat protein
MFKKNIGNNYFILIVALSFYFIALIIHQKTPKPTFTVSKQDTATNITHDFLQIMSFGNKRLLADMLWIQTLLESDLVKYHGKDLNSWMYLRFRTISALDPLFYENYLYGGMLLSIVKDDLEGAADIYSRGIKIYPDDYKLNYNAGFNYYFEMGDFKKGLTHLEKVAKHPSSPQPLKFIINKLRFEQTHNFDAALDFIKFNLENNRDPILEKKLRSDLYALKAERDLNCLNLGKSDCERLDSEENLYIKRDGKWVSQKPFTPYRIYKKDRAN